MSLYKQLLIASVLSLLSLPALGAKIFVQSDSDMYSYGCPFDVGVYIDAQGENLKGASLNIDITSGLVLQGFSFDERFGLSFPIMRTGNNLKAFGFVFPNTFTGIVKFATLRIMQNDPTVKSASLHFLHGKTGDSSDFMDVFYPGGMDALQGIENKTFLFGEGNCAPVGVLSGDFLGSGFNSQGHLMSLYNMIDEFTKQNKTSFQLFVQNHIYWVISLLVLLILALVYLLFHKRINKAFKRNSNKNA